DGITRWPVLGSGAAPVVLEVIDAPCCVLARILEFVAAAAGSSCASLGAGVGVDTELQALGVDIVGDGLDAVGKRLGVGLDVAILVARNLPAVVDDDVLVPGV